MNHDLKKALSNPSAVMIAGPRDSDRPSTRNITGLRALGAMLLLGAASAAHADQALVRTMGAPNPMYPLMPVADFKAQGQTAVANAYEELRDGYTASNPSVALVEACRTLARVGNENVSLPANPHNTPVFNTCSSAAMVTSTRRLQAQQIEGAKTVVGTVFGFGALMLIGTAALAGLGGAPKPEEYQPRKSRGPSA